MATAAQAKPKKPAASKKPHDHPPFAEMITDAIVSLKERTGSSQYAIAKFIEKKHKDLPPTFRKLLLRYLKKSVGDGKLVKVKNSFKLPPARSAPVKATSAAAPKKPKSAKAAESKPSAKAASKPKPKTATKQKAVARPKSKTVAASAKPKAKAAGKPAKVGRTAGKTSPGKKVAPKPARKAPIKGVKKPKTVKSPAKKAPAKKVKK